jgi:hypothetical protein
VQAYRWLLPGESDLELQSLPARYRLTFYAGSVLGSPRHLLSLFRPDRLDSSPYAPVRNGDIFVRADEHGAVKIERGLVPDSFTRWTPSAPQLDPRSMTYSDAARADFRFTGDPLNRFQTHFLRLCFELLERRKIPAALVHVPLWHERASNVVEERMDWPAIFGRNVELVGVPPARLFAGMTEKEKRLLYYNTPDLPKEHLNRNGSEYFTRTIAPAIVEIYVRRTSTPL